jgi:hypothetical protein
MGVDGGGSTRRDNVWEYGMSTQEEKKDASAAENAGDEKEWTRPMTRFRRNLQRLIGWPPFLTSPSQNSIPV